MGNRCVRVELKCSSVKGLYFIVDMLHFSHPVIYGNAPTTLPIILIVKDDR